MILAIILYAHVLYEYCVRNDHILGGGYKGQQGAKVVSDQVKEYKSSFMHTTT